MSALGRRWSSSWFAPATPAELATCRLVWSGLCVLHLSTSGIGARIEAGAASAASYAPLPILSVLAAPFGGPHGLGADDLRALLLATQICGVLAFVGLGTRVVLPLFALGGLLLQAWAYSFGEFVHDAALLEWALFVLAFAPCGRAFSVDAWIARRRGRAADAFVALPDAAWSLRLVHVLLALAYLSAGATKLARGAEEWLGGSTLQYYVSFFALRNENELGLWLMKQRELVVVLAWTVVLLETSFVLTLWLRRWAWIWVLGSCVVHGGALLFMGVWFPAFPALSLAILPWSRIYERLGVRARSA